MNDDLPVSPTYAALPFSYLKGGGRPLGKSPTGRGYTSERRDEGPPGRGGAPSGRGDATPRRGDAPPGGGRDEDPHYFSYDFDDQPPAGYDNRAVSGAHDQHDQHELRPARRTQQSYQQHPPGGDTRPFQADVFYYNGGAQPAPRGRHEDSHDDRHDDDASPQRRGDDLYRRAEGCCTTASPTSPTRPLYRPEGASDGRPADLDRRHSSLTDDRRPTTTTCWVVVVIVVAVVCLGGGFAAGWFVPKGDSGK